MGVYELEDVYERLHRVFEDDADAYDERRSACSACAGLVIDQEGRLVPRSAVLSSALWAVARIENPGPRNPGWAGGFPLAQGIFDDAVTRYENDRLGRGRHQSPAHGARSIRDLLRIAQRVSGIADVVGLSTDGIVVESKVVPLRRSDENPDTDFLNSFYLEDLGTVRDHVIGDDMTGSAPAAYLTGDRSLDTRHRVDVMADPETVNTGALIDRLPRGRWPSDPRHGLALSQQFAVNRALNDLAPSRGLMGVNGPPGTGKTTMLRDILAGNVVERARRLASLPRAGEAFIPGPYTWNTRDGYRRRVPRLRPELTGFEMVIASGNNAAVENVTTEIPAKDAMDRRWQDKADYFGDIASAVLRETMGDEQKTDALLAWGIIAARLGNKRNRDRFHSSFWFDRTTKGASGRPVDGIWRMQSRLKRWRDGTVPHKGWDQARQDLLANTARDMLDGLRAACDVVAVGDPLQLQPIVTVPQKAQRDIAATRRISPTWIPPRASVQTLADRISRYGTWLPQGEERVWVGAPLRVHRRCDEPMFSLCNWIAYNGIMINGVHRVLDDPERPDPFDSPGHPVVGPSCWVDEPAPTPGSHLQENQIARFERMLGDLAGQGVGASDVIAVSPFRDVTDRLRSLIPRHPGLQAGTIHTAQGREAPVVVLVLGGDPSSPGAKKWAASTVNLVNVAASRAERRLYVIGDRASWERYNYFRDLSEFLGGVIGSWQQCLSGRGCWCEASGAGGCRSGRDRGGAR